MRKRHKPVNPATRARLLEELHQDLERRLGGYREQALKLLPHVCASCGRNFAGRRLRELTVHHKDHNWKNNPPDGSNWELLCLYCHDHEHEKYKMADYADGAPENLEPAPSIFQPFANLDQLRARPPADSAPPADAPGKTAATGPALPDGLCITC